MSRSPNDGNILKIGHIGTLFTKQNTYFNNGVVMADTRLQVVYVMYS